MTQPQWQILQSTGTSHLLAISGLHVGLVAALVFAVTRRLWSWSGAAKWWPAPRFRSHRSHAGSACLCLVSRISGTRSAGPDYGVGLDAGDRDGGQARSWRVLGLALWLVILMDPLAGLSAGFWLSFGAVALIFFLSGGRHGAQSRIKRLLTLQAGLVAGLMPLTWLWFQQASWVALPANLLAIPWVGTLMVPLLLLAVLLLPGFAEVSQCCFTCRPGYSTCSGYGSSGSLNSRGCCGQRLQAMLDGYYCVPVGLLLFLLPRAFRAGTAGGHADSSRISGYTRPARRWRPVGEPCSTLARGFPWCSKPANTSWFMMPARLSAAVMTRVQRVVVPFLGTRGIRKLDRLIISHGDNDHRGGVASLLAATAGSEHPQR